MVNSNKLSVSGISSGGYMAVQYHVSNSMMVDGVGVIAGGPYYCANNNILIALNNCMVEPILINVEELILATGYAYKLLSIDDPKYISNARIFLYSGTKDNTVYQGVVKKLESYYRHFIKNSSQFMIEYGINGGHNFPTLDYGIKCDSTETPYIGKCDYDGAYKILSHIYNTTLSRTKQIESNILLFNQSKYIPKYIVHPNVIGLDEFGYMYIPTKCKNKLIKCDIHIVFHGCLQSKYFIDKIFVMNTGYNDIAEANNIIIIYPQTYPIMITNPKACWDWWGYTGADYASKLSSQIITINNIVNDVKN